jgi:hypothetical protein
MYLATEEIFSIFVKGLQNVQRESGHVIRKKKETQLYLGSTVLVAPANRSIKSHRFLYL